MSAHDRFLWAGPVVAALKPGTWAIRTTPARYAAAVFIVVAASAIAELLFRVLHTTRLSPVFLAAVLICGVNLGSGPAYLAAVLAFGIYNFYLAEPRFSFSLNPEDLVVLVVFLLVALLTGRLTGRLRDHERDATARADAQRMLFEASREFAGTLSESGIRSVLARRIAAAAGDAAAVIGSNGQVAGSAKLGIAPSELIALLQGAGAGDEVEGEVATVSRGEWRTRPLKVGGQALGLTAWRPSPDVQEPVDERMLDLLVDLGASAILRARLSDERSEVDALAKTERLRSTLLSSLSHDLRTPLASILASTSSLRQFGGQLSPQVQADLILTIQEEAERLNLFVENLLSMSRLEAGALMVRAEAVNLQQIIESVAARCASRKRGRRIAQAGFDGVQAIGDPVLLEQALINVLENAYRFSPDATVVELAAWRRGGEVVLEIADEGPGVAEAELDRIFEKFYRCKATDKLPGTGLGLSITKGLIEAMGGAVDARGREEGPGLRVRITLPATP